MRLITWSPLPSRPKHRGEQGLHTAWRDVDDKPGEVAFGDGLEMVGDGVDMPAGGELAAWLEDEPGQLDERGDGIFGIRFIELAQYPRRVR